MKAAGGIADPGRHCYRCERERPADAFTTRIDDRHYRMCRSCVSEILKERGARKTRLPHSSTDRVCYLCRRTLPNASFTRRSSGTYFSACKDCNRHVFGHRRRARLAAAAGTYTTAEWEALCRLYDRCPACLREWHTIPTKGAKTVITVDHIVPISRGGSNSIENIQPLCYACNSRKGSKVV
jgi:5-methylcytosine-specific restriction endonuclease McrA